MGRLIVSDTVLHCIIQNRLVKVIILAFPHTAHWPEDPTRPRGFGNSYDPMRHVIRRAISPFDCLHNLPLDRTGLVEGDVSIQANADVRLLLSFMQPSDSRSITLTNNCPRQHLVIHDSHVTAIDGGDQRRVVRFPGVL